MKSLSMAMFGGIDHVQIVSNVFQILRSPVTKDAYSDPQQAAGLWVWDLRTAPQRGPPAHPPPMPLHPQPNQSDAPDPVSTKEIERCDIYDL